MTRPAEMLRPASDEGPNPKHLLTQDEPPETEHIQAVKDEPVVKEYRGRHRAEDPANVYSNQTDAYSDLPLPPAATPSEFSDPTNAGLPRVFTDQTGAFPAARNLSNGPSAPTTPEARVDVSRLPELDRPPEYAALVENLRGAAVEATEPGPGLEELRQMLELAKRGNVPAAVLTEVIGEAHTLDAKFAHDPRFAEDGRNRTYEAVLADLKYKVYGTVNVQPTYMDHVLSRDEPGMLKVSWLGMPFQVHPLGANYKDNPSATLQVSVGRDFAVHVHQNDGGKDVVVQPQHEVTYGRKHLSKRRDKGIASEQVRIHNQSPIGVAVEDLSEPQDKGGSHRKEARRRGTVVRVHYYPDPAWFKEQQEHEYRDPEDELNAIRHRIDRL